MNIVIDNTELLPVIRATIEETLAAMRNADSQLPIGRLSYSEQEAAGLIGVAKHVLREARYDGKIAASRVGRGVVYQREELLAYLARQQIKNGAAE